MIKGSLCGLPPPGAAAAVDGGDAPVASSADGFASSVVDIVPLASLLLCGRLEPSSDGRKWQWMGTLHDDGQTDKISF